MKTKERAYVPLAKDRGRLKKQMMAATKNNPRVVLFTAAQVKKFRTQGVDGMKTKKTNATREIARRNRKFKAAAAAEKRVLIAKDVIAQVKAGRFKVGSGNWVVPLTRSGSDLSVDRFEEDESVQKLFLEGDIPKCECCALGAMFMSCTLYNNKTTAIELEDVRFSFSDYVEEGSFTNGLSKFFSKDQLKLIESAFEGNCGAFCLEQTAEWEEGLLPGDKTFGWMSRLRDDKKRLVAIMENIIKNKGKFVP